MAAKSSKWDMANWQAGKVTLFQALGLGSADIQYPQLDSTIPATDVAISTVNQPGPQNTGKTQTTGGGKSGGGSGGGSSGGGGAPPAVGSCNSATTSANKKLAQQLAGSFGWGSGNQWTAFNNIVMAESGYCNTIKNPTSTAYGIGQFLDSTWAGVGGTKTSDPKTQIQLMLKYIKNRYGTPAQAWAFHLANGWY